MAKKPTYEELEQKVKELEKESVERKRAEEALRSEKNKLQALMDGLARTQIGIDIVGTDYKILFQNQTLKERFGDLTGKLCYEKYMGLEKPCDFCPMIEAITSGKVESVQLTAADGRNYELLSAPIPNPDGTVDKAIEVVLDTTERKQAEEALRESEAQKKAILDASVDRIRLVDKDMRIIWANKTTARELNVAPEDLVGQFCYEGLIGKDTPCPECPTKKALKSGNIEHAVIHQPKSKGIEGETYWDSYAVPIKDESGDIVNLIQIARNITEAKRAEEALRESEGKYKTLTENSLTGIFILQDGRYVFVNDRFAEIHGYKPEEMYEKYHLEFIHPDERDVLKQITSRRLNGEAVPQRYEVRRLRKDGKTVWCEMMAARIQHRGKPATMGNIIDINERKRAEEALRESELWMRSMFNSLEETVLIITPDRFIVDINEAAERIFGYSKDELMNRSTEILHVDHEHYLEFGGRMKEAFDNRKAARFEFELKRKNGEIFPTERTTSLLKHDEGKPMGILSVIRDLSEQKRAEEEKKNLEAQFQAAQRMEAMGTLAGGIAHNFNNILMGIQGNASLALLNKTSTHPDYERLKGIEQGVKSGAELTRQLLGFARGGKYEVKPTDLNELIKNQNRMFGRTKKEITVRGKYEESLWTAEVDQGQIEQALLNLYVNAWQAMPAGGDLYIQTENTTLDEDYAKPFTVDPGRYVKISVTDTGVGMDEATQQRIFEPFFTTQEMGRGTGLGLASVYGIVRNHGGIINVYSEKGEGTTFNIYLPASEKEVIEEKEVVGEALKGTETVLLVDDEDMIIDVGVGILTELGYKVLLARGGKEAIEIYKKNKDNIDMVILDMIMPGVGGGETYDRLKKINPDIKVLLSSGYSINGQATEILERGCNGFIQKPFNMKVLSQELRKILDG